MSGVTLQAFADTINECAASGSGVSVLRVRAITCPQAVSSHASEDHCPEIKILSFAARLSCLDPLSPCRPRTPTHSQIHILTHAHTRVQVHTQAPHTPF
eukprot:1202233-Rhodomonas_salina.2